MMDEATKKEYLRRHWILWNWLAEHPHCETKTEAFDALGWNHSSDDSPLIKIDWPLNDCYLCQIEWERNGSMDDCSECPLFQIDNEPCCHGNGTYFDKWNDARSNANRKKYAVLIRDVAQKP